MASDKPLLSTSAETPLSKAVHPSAPLVRIVLKAIDGQDARDLDQCLADQGLIPKDYAALLLTVRIDAAAGHTLWFVRPALEPYCQALYGAHLFRYFLIDQQSSAPHPGYRLVFRHGGDAFDIYAHKSHFLNDIEATGCIADECRSARMSFDGAAYQPVSCTRITFGTRNQEIEHQRRCGSDDDPDDQSSGAEMRSARQSAPRSPAKAR